MARTPQEINGEYANLCAEMGHRCALIQKLEGELAGLKRAVAKLDKEMVQAKELAEAMAAKAVAQAEALAKDVVNEAKVLVGSTSATTPTGTTTSDAILSALQKTSNPAASNS